MKRRARWLFIPGILVVVLAIAAVSVLQSDWLREKIRRRIVTGIERASGGRASVSSFDFDWRKLTVSTGEIVLHGKEAEGREPLFRARSVRIGLTVLSWLRPEVRLSELAVDQPEFRIYVAEDGSTNLPSPAVKKEGGNPIADLLRIKIGKLDVRNGLFEFDSRQLPFYTVAEGLDFILTYDTRNPRYRAAVAAKAVHLPGHLAPGVEATAVLEADRLLIEKAQVRIGESTVEYAAAISGFKHPRVDGNFRGSVQLRDVPPSPIRQGFGVVTGQMQFDQEHGLVIEGRLEAEQIGWASRDVRLKGLRTSSQFQLTPHSLKLTGLVFNGPYGRWEGSGDIENWKRFRLDGRATEVSLDTVQAALLDTPYPWNGLIEGPVNLSGEFTPTGVANLVADADLSIAPREGEIPVEGALRVNWRQDSGQVDFGDSWLSTKGARVQFHGVLGLRLEAGFVATSLQDVNAVVGLATRQRNFQLPISLEGGEARINASVLGPVDRPEIQGRVSLRGAVYRDIHIQSVESNFHLTNNQIALTNLALHENKALVRGNLALSLSDWALDKGSRLNASVHLQNAELPTLLRSLKTGAPLNGILVADIELQGTAGNPYGQTRFSISNLAWEKEKFTTVTGSASLTEAGEFRGEITAEKTRVDLTGDYRHPAGDFRNGSLNAKITLAGYSIRDSETVQEYRPGLDALLGSEMTLRAGIENGEARLHAFDGSLSAPSLQLGNRKFGALKLTAETSGDILNLKLLLGLRDGSVEGDARVQLSGDYPAEGNVKLPRLGFALLRDVASTNTEAGAESRLPVHGFLDGEVAWKGPLATPRKLTAQVTVRDLQVQPREAQVLETQVDTNELTLRNSGPLVFDIDANSARVRSAKLTALETNLTLTGNYSFTSKNPWNLNLQGAANLAILGSFHRDLIASGSASIDAAVRGAARDPQLSGRMNIENASLYLKDLPNGIEGASGTVYFERNRANIEKLTGQTGGGKFEISGFVGVNGTDVTYRLQASATNIRVRYPEGVSTTLDAALTLTGSTERSLLAGNITLQRAGFTTSGDLGSMMSASGNPIPPAASQNEFLRNLQFDVRIRTSPDAVFLTSYTQDLETEADLRLRGSPAKPILLGSVKANRGGVQFFGNRYTISRGEVLFYNTAVIQPQLDLDLETRVRGITVYINVSGPLNRLNITYRSEPPLESSEILALLTVGRTPTSESTSMGVSQNIRSQNVMENTPNSLLGGALSAGLSSRTERFFGSSRIKIDPSSTGVDNLPQARLSLEQSLSRDITLTFVTNLSHSNQQLVRIEWDFSRQWSAIVVKDENGVFAVDFLYRKRFK